MSETAPIASPCTCFSLRRLTRTVTRLYDSHLAAIGIKTTQYSLLRIVAHAPLPIAELAARLAMERTTLTRNLGPLLDAGWIVLAKGNDARQKIVTITDAGRETIKSARSSWRQAQTEMDRTLGNDAVRALHQQLDTALQQLTPLLEGRMHASEI